jgi:molecular chaperone Hsp33
MLVAQATDALEVRGVAHVDATHAELGTYVENSAAIGAADAGGMLFADLVGGGRLVVTVEQGANASPWQGIVPLDGDSLAQCLESYFAASEQLPTAIVLAADAHSAAGLLLQKLPVAAAQGEAAAALGYDLWDEASLLLSTLSAEELLALEPEELLQRLFGERDLRLFDGEAVHFACRCDRERVAAMLQGFGQQESESVVAEQGAITVTCEFCQRPYRFDAVDVAQLFLAGAAAGAALKPH